MDQLFISSPFIKNINSNENEIPKKKRGTEFMYYMYRIYMYVYFSVL